LFRSLDISIRHIRHARRRRDLWGREEFSHHTLHKTKSAKTAVIAVAIQEHTATIVPHTQTLKSSDTSWIASASAANAQLVTASIINAGECCMPTTKLNVISNAP
jgi:hypothetical protein